MQSNILTTKKSADYELLDSGQGFKLERFGEVVLSRPDPQALWNKNLSDADWKIADGTFTKSWSFKKGMPDKWSVDFEGIKFVIRPSTFKHVGVFPEQASNWSWIKERASRNSNIEILNLFGYTGGATLAAASAGAKVVHVDGSKVAIGWARENAELSGLDKKPIRWILDDAHKFVKREIKRGRKYDGIIMDPPSFGHGPDNEVWKIEESLLPLIDDCLKLLADKPIFFLINGYAAGYSAIAYANILPSLKSGSIESGELTIEESKSGRLLPCGIFARWSA